MEQKWAFLEGTKWSIFHFEYVISLHLLEATSCLRHGPTWLATGLTLGASVRISG